mmetsp:Transcript_29441/g.51629  ORF Transcript_29441/g.51629 Transcript_29441/m.51629 type:complete len:221 (+) Transcript_29441:102-764(+)
MEDQSQVTQMKEFILNEAKDKAEEIEAKALQEFNIEKMKMLEEAKEKLQQDYTKKQKATDTKNAIARSTAVNKSRLTKIEKRQEMLTLVKAGAEGKLTDKLKSEANSKAFIEKLIVQGLLMLLEEEVTVQCAAKDDKVVESCFDSAAKQYTEVIKKETGATKKVKLTLDKTKKLDIAKDLGGIVLTCQDGSIVIDNTIKARLGLVLDQAKPQIRKLLFAK